MLIKLKIFSLFGVETKVFEDIGGGLLDTGSMILLILIG